MDIKAYISSGIIEDYVLGMTSKEENEEILLMQEKYPEVAEAIEAYEQTLEDFASLHAVRPPSELKTKVMQNLGDSNKDDSAPESNPHPVVQKLRIWKRIAVAAVILFIISAGINIFYIPKYNHYKAEYLLTRNNQKRILAKNRIIETRLEKVKNNMHLLMNPNVKPIVMKGVKGHDGLEATVFWNKQNSQTYLGKMNLPTPPSGKTYQLWAIVNGHPVDLGIYNPQKDNRLKSMKALSGGEVQAFAITLEKAGGSATPTMDQMYVMGGTS